MIKILENPTDFYELNKKSWSDNASYWLEQDFYRFGLSNFLLQKITKILPNFNHIPHIVDIGCGSGWLLDALLANKLSFSYSGIDYNETFIEHLQIRHNETINFKFLQIDIEKDNFDNLSNIDIAICCLSLIEITDLDGFFRKISSKMNDNAIIIIVGLDPTTEIIRYALDDLDLQQIANYYRKSDKPVYISKKFITKNRHSKSEYFRILYSISDYNLYAKKYGFGIYKVNVDFNKKSTKADAPVFQIISYVKKIEK